MIRSILKSIYDRAKSIVVVLALSFILVGCYTTVGVQSEPTYSYGYGYYWGWYGGHYGYYPYWYIHPYPRYYIPPHRVHAPSYYEKHPEQKSRDFGNTRQRDDVRKQNPPPKQENKRPQGSRR